MEIEFPTGFVCKKRSLTIWVLEIECRDFFLKGIQRWSKSVEETQWMLLPVGLEN